MRNFKRSATIFAAPMIGRERYVAQQLGQFFLFAFGKLEDLLENDLQVFGTPFDRVPQQS